MFLFYIILFAQFLKAHTKFIFGFLKELQALHKILFGDVLKDIIELDSVDGFRPLKNPTLEIYV